MLFFVIVGTYRLIFIQVLFVNWLVVIDMCFIVFSFFFFKNQQILLWFCFVLVH